MSIAELRKLVEGNETYPPSEMLWKHVVMLAEKKTEKSTFNNLQEQMKREANKYRPSLPEPKVSRFHHDGKYYYLDANNRIYEIDEENPIVGNLVGEISGDKVIINKEEVYKIPKVIVSEKKIEIKVEGKIIDEKMYYVDDERKMYRGFHINHPYVVMIGKLTSCGKIDITR